MQTQGLTVAGGEHAAGEAAWEREVEPIALGAETPTDLELRRHRRTLILVDSFAWACLVIAIACTTIAMILVF
jgi:hypothetical protein